MIPIEALRAVRRIITHANCADGRASAVILHAALPNAEIVEVVHDTREHREMAAEPGLLFCDFTPPASRAAEFVASGATVLDHHKGAEAVVRAFGQRGVFADEKAEPGVSGAVLAYLHVYLRVLGAPSIADGLACDAAEACCRLAYLVGIRDTWQRSSPDWDRACAVSAAVRFLPLDEALKRGPVGVMAFASEAGALLVRKQMEAAREAARHAVRVEIGGRRVALISSVSLTSDVADLLREHCEIVAGFDYVHDERGSRLQWSLRACSHVDVSAIARRHGGNGHTAAAGFSVQLDPEDPSTQLNPYRMAERLL